MAAFMTPEWAQDCRAAINAWPGAEQRDGKLPEYWEWIETVQEDLTGRVALCVRDAPGGVPDTLCLELDAGKVADATVGDRAGSEPDAAFLLAGSYADWQDMLAGYDVGKTVMYRRLMLEKGDTLEFFRTAFYWTELLAAIQSVGEA